MANIRQEKGNIFDFKSDVIICPCYTDLTYAKDEGLFRKLNQTAGPELIKELTAVGHCAIGNAIITLPYKLSQKRIVFIAYKDLNNKDAAVDHLLLHQAYRNALNLAVIYGLKIVSTSIIPVAVQKQKVTSKISGLFKLDVPPASVNPMETIEIAKTVASEFDEQIDEFVIFE